MRMQIAPLVSCYKSVFMVTNKRVISKFMLMMTDSMKDAFVKINAFQNSFKPFPFCARGHLNESSSREPSPTAQLFIAEIQLSLQSRNVPL